MKKMKSYVLLLTLIGLASCLGSSPVGAETASFGPAQDAYVRKYYPADVFLDSSLRTGVATWTPSSPYNGGNAHAFIQFDLTGLPETVTRAVLRLYSHSSQGGYYPEGLLELFAVTGSWQESLLTWNSQPGWEGAVSASAPFTIYDQYVELDLTDLYGQWKNGLANFGVMLNTAGSEEAGSCYGNGEWNCRPGMFYSSRAEAEEVRPVLIIEYEVAPEPANIVIGDCDTGVLDLEYEGAWVSELIAECASQASNHGDFVSCVSHLANDLKKAGLISGKEMGAIVSCAAQSDIP